MTETGELRIYHGAVALITGGASGIGRALGAELARRGASVVLADLQADLAEQAADEIRQDGGKAETIGLDVADFDAVQAAVEDTTSRHGRLDFLFNNAGIAVAGETARYEIDDWMRVLDVNLRGVVHGIQAAYPVMIRQGFGHIINLGSILGLTPGPLATSYSASKHAIVGLSTSLRSEAAQRGVRVSVLCPGAVDTPILRDGGKFGKQLGHASPELKERLRKLVFPVAPDRFARQALRAVAKNRAIIVLPRWWHIPWWLHRLSPGLTMHLRSRLVRKVQAMS